MSNTKSFIKSLNHAAFNVTKYEEVVDFYVNTLGLTNKFSIYDDEGKPWLTYIEIGDHQYLELFPVDESQITKVHGRNRSFHHICLIVDDIVGLANDLMRKGVQLWQGPSFLGQKVSDPYVPVKGKAHSYSFYMDDPEGNYIEIMQFTEESLQLK